jgi:23S rRNA pseudouridine2605 synthase
MLYKPRSVVCTCSDEHGRKTVVDFFSNTDKRLFPVGRLDYDSEGLVLMTTDGELANLITHPSYGIKKAYRATIDKHYDLVKADEIKTGVDIGDERPAQALSINFRNRADGRAVITLEIAEGRNREVRRILEAQGYNVLRLVRFRIGSLEIGCVAPGKFIKLSKEQAYLAAKNMDYNVQE